MSISKDYPCIKSKDKNPLLEEKDGHLIGKNPKFTEKKLIEGGGHTKAPILKVIRKKCLDCCGFQAGEVRKCILTSCPLWPYRMGSSPFRSYEKIGEE